MLLQVFLVLKVSNTLHLYPNPMLFNNFEIAGTFLWFEIEWLVFLGTLMSNAIFIAFRCLFRHKISVDNVPESKQIPTIDTILAIRGVVDAFNSQFVPLVVSLFLVSEDNNGLQKGNPCFLELMIILCSNVSGSIMALCMIFVHWQKGSERWKKISPRILIGIVAMLYFVIPAINIIAFFFLILQRDFKLVD